MFDVDSVDDFIPEEESLDSLNDAVEVMETQITFNNHRINLPYNQRPGPFSVIAMEEENVKLNEMLQRCKKVIESLNNLTRPENDLDMTIRHEERIKKKVLQKVTDKGQINKKALEELQ